MCYDEKSIDEKVKKGIQVMTKQEFIKTIPGIKALGVVFSQATRMPMVFCHEETMDDYIYVYLEAEEAKEKVQALSDAKEPAFVVNCKDKEVLQFFGEPRLTGVNAVCFVTPKAQGGEEFMVQLTEFLRFPDLNSLPEEKRPLENTTLHLSMLYFMQEMRKPVAREEKQNLAELEEETSANLAKGKFLIPVKEAAEGEEQGKRAIMMLKNEKGEVFFPLFTDAAELRKFAKGQDCQVVHGTFAMVADMMKKGDVTGLVVNPASINLILTKPGVASVEKRFLA